MPSPRSNKATALRLNPRKVPTQIRATRTVQAILEGAAHILERKGLEGYTTNAIAERAGVSIGSLYQYFPTRDAVTIALIERESAALVAEVQEALLIQDFKQALRALVKTAVRHQLRRPELARLLDFEQSRLSNMMPATGNASAVHAAIVEFVKRGSRPKNDSPEVIANNIIVITSALTDVAGRRRDVDPVALENSISGALAGYLGMVLDPA